MSQLSNSDERILRQCSSSQKERVEKFLGDGWKIDDYDGDVLIKKGFSYKWVKRDGYTCAA